ncbi:serine palmitoyltransferase 2-like isoform X1 [Portunus trituberculatus]|uniref:serine palmitoyltransferase 2-like isoform X1 n=1 Tax=Portunus trituberculatus TaxID=210409 RepID=UPI001E1D1515|nr:serine palmitoyltransferase 2-like isoform X1 [Portunus trituberculatus]
MVAHTELPAQLPHEKIVSSGKDLECRNSDSGSGVTERQELQDNSVQKNHTSQPNGSSACKKSYHKEEECSLFVAFFTFLSYGVLLMLGYVREFFMPITTKEKNREHKKKNAFVTSQIRDIEECPSFTNFTIYLSYGVLFLVGYVKEFFYPPSTKETNREGYVPLYIGFESFYTRNVYRRIQDCWNRAISSVPGAEIDLLERYTPDYGWTMKLTGKVLKCINAGSYNYLGFAENHGPCHDAAELTTKEVGITTSSSRLELGTLEIHKKLEALVSEFLGVEDAITFGMGFATNVLNLPSILGPGCLVLSDEFNHASLILGLRLSGATVKVFQHNNAADLEKKLREALIHGHPRTRRPWKKAMIVVEGIYSMEGSICDLPNFIRIKKKYKTYLYVDEAHSIGALGPRGGGVVDYYGADPKDVDIHMGTFTKSFGAAGGYIAGSKELVNHLRVNSHAQSYAVSMSPPVAQQIITSMSIIMGKDGSNEGRRRIQQLARNVKYFRQRLRQMGFIVYGHDDSPVVPLLLYLIPKITMFVRELTKRGVAGVGVGFPATKITGGRMRFCLSAAHTKEMLDKILKEVDVVGDMCSCKYSKIPKSAKPIEW